MVVVPAGLQERALWVGVALLAIPLGILLALQYRSLAEIERTATEAERIRYLSYLQAVSVEVRTFYRSRIDQVLSLPPEGTVEGYRRRAVEHFKEADWKGARRLFFLDDSPSVLAFDPRRRELVPVEDGDEARVLREAWAMERHLLEHKPTFFDTYSVLVNEEDPRYRAVFKPVRDPQLRLLGSSVLLLDPEFFEKTYLPEAVQKSVPEDVCQEIDVGLVFDPPAAATPMAPLRRGEYALRLHPFFADAHLVFRSRAEAPGAWARSSFRLNLSLFALVALVLAGAMLLALRSAAHAVRLSRIKTDFVSNISHELRTPLASIRVFAEFLREGRVADDSKMREYGRLIDQEAHRMIRLVDAVLAFSKVESEKTASPLRSHRLRDVVEATVQAFDVRLREKGFTIALEVDEAADPLVRMDPGMVAEALGNLVDNAVKYSGEGRLVRVRLESAGDEARVAVVDLGIGIPAAEQGRIFDKFYRVSRGEEYEVEGTGLGLALVKQVMERHGGRVSVSSAPSRGSTFTLHFPMAVPAGAPADATRRAEPAPDAR